MWPSTCHHPRVPAQRRRRAEAARGPRLGLAVLASLVAALIWIELPVPALSTTVAPPQHPPARWDLAWLSTRDQRIVDSEGRTVILRGFNSSTLLEPTVRRAPLDDSDAALIETSGFDVVRLAISWGRLEPRRGVWDRAYLEEIAATVRRLNAHHLYVVLDMHFLDWSAALGGSGAPSWAVLPGLPNPRLGWLGDWQRHLSPAVNGAQTYFWLAPDWQADFLQAWQRLAARFSGDSGVAGYDLYNEPHALPLPPVRFERDWLWPLYARTIDAIAAVDSNHLFIVEGQLFGDFGTTIVPLRAPDLVYSPHEYTGSLVPPVFDGNPSALDAHVAQVAQEAARVPAALWVGEWGIAANQGGAMRWVDDALDAFAAAGAGWAWWQWREDSPWGVRDNAGRIDQELLGHLARPYLAAAPPGVTTASAGSAAALRVQVAAGHGGAPVEVAWPVGAGTPRVTGDCRVDSAWDSTRARLTLRVPPRRGCALLVTPS